ncbi:diguanylate cyclase [bacterium]|nr:diguanylate cyclase [bacterium]
MYFILRGQGKFRKSHEFLIAVLGGLFSLLFFHLGFLTEIENRIRDFQFRIRGELPDPHNLVLVAITDECIQNLGSWPWPRATHAKLLKILKKSGAKVVVFDIMFKESSSFGEGDDQEFLSSIEDSGNVILPVVMNKRIVLDPQSCEMVEMEFIDGAIPLLRRGAIGEGFIDVEYQTMNRDGIIRNLILEKPFEGKLIPSLGLSIAVKYLGESISRSGGRFFLGKIEIPMYERIENRDLTKPITSFSLNYAGSSTDYFDQKSYSDVLNESFPLDFFKGKAVIVGTRAKGIHEDLKFSPFGPIAGMEIHANFLHNVTSGRLLRRMSPLCADFLILFLSIGMGFLLWWVGGIFGNLLAVFYVFGYSVLCLVLFYFDFILEVFPVVGLLPAEWAGIRLIQFFFDLKHRIRELTIVNEVSQAVNFLGDVSKTLDAILSRAVQALSAERGSIFLLDGRYENLVEAAVVLSGGETSTLNPEIREKFKIGEGIAGEVFLSGKPRLIKDARKDKAFKTYSKQNLLVSSLICVPLQVKENFIGVMNIVNKTDGEFDQENLQLTLFMANQAAVIIENARLYNLATIDGLTGLVVHRHFQAKLEEEFRRAKRYDKPLSFIMTDIDHFKKFNDTWGHQTGDLVLREVAICVRKSIRDTDVAARYGGEEFAVILPETDEDGASLFAERLRQRVESSAFQGPKGELKVTISLGVSSFPKNPVETTLEMIKLADEALYSAKHSGRNRVGIASLLGNQNKD